jgi:hypothetical protein
MIINIRRRNKTPTIAKQQMNNSLNAWCIIGYCFSVYVTANIPEHQNATEKKTRAIAQ